MISIIIPCFNEENNIKKAYDKIKTILDSIKRTYEIIFIDDGSTDNTLKQIKSISNNDKKVKFISFSRNFGKEAAIYSGLKYASGKYIGLMDADLQDPPELLPKMVKILDENIYDVVLTRRINRKGENIFKKIFSKLYYKINNCISKTKINDGERDFRLMKKYVVDSILQITEQNRFSKEIFNWVGYNKYCLEFENIERKNGKSKWNLRQLYKYGIDNIYNSSDFIVKFNLLINLIVFIITFILTILKITNILNVSCEIIVLLLLSTILCIQMSFITRYIYNINNEIRKRPHYIIKTTNINNDKIHS